MICFLQLKLEQLSNRTKSTVLKVRYYERKNPLFISAPKSLISYNKQ